MLDAILVLVSETPDDVVDAVGAVRGRADFRLGARPLNEVINAGHLLIVGLCHWSVLS